MTLFCTLDNYLVWRGSSQVYVTSLLAQSRNQSRFVFPARLLCLQGNVSQHPLPPDVFIWNFWWFLKSNTWTQVMLKKCIVPGNRWKQGILHTHIERTFKPESFVLQLVVSGFQNWKINLWHGTSDWIQPHHFPDCGYTWGLSLGPMIPRDVGAKCSMNQAGVHTWGKISLLLSFPMSSSQHREKWQS